MLVWIDLETTGLDPEQHTVLEVACIITDDQLNEVARFERVTTEAKHCDLSKVDPYVLEMHAKNGLWNASLLASEDSRYEYGPPNEKGLYPIVKTIDAGAIKSVDIELSAFILTYAEVNEKGEKEFGEKHGPQLAGSTIGFDRAFLKKRLPSTFGTLHYRSIDVTAFNETARRFMPDLHEARPRSGPEAAHRGMADIEESIAVYKYYVNEFVAAMKIADVVVAATDVIGTVVSAVSDALEGATSGAV